MNKKEAIVKILRGWSDNELVDAWNRRCEAVNDYDSNIESMYSFNDLFCGRDPLDIAELVCRGKFCSGDDYFAFNGYGNIVTFSYPDDTDSPFDYDELADYLIDYGDSETREVDTDNLVEFFEEWFANNRIGIDTDVLDEIVNILIEEESFDLLTDEWEILAQEVDERLEDYNDNNDDEEDA